MSASCRDPIADERLVDYWAGELEREELDALEDHLFACAACSARSARVAAVTEAMRGMVPLLLDGARLAELRARGLRVVEGTFRPGERKPVVFAAGVDLLVHRLGGLDLARAERVRVVLRAEQSGEPLVDVPFATFERASGEVLVACQRHFEVFPRDIVAEVRVTLPAGAEQVATYAIEHRYE